MNNHLLPSLYNLLPSPTWTERIIRPLCNLFLKRSSKFRPQIPSTVPISFQDNGGDLPPIRIVCISDTHNATPELPLGDILIHAGDLTAHGTFDEVQAQLRWLASQPHPHKIVVAGNHDIVLDEACDDKFLTWRRNSAEEREKLDWGSILQGKRCAE